MAVTDHDHLHHAASRTPTRDDVVRRGALVERRHDRLERHRGRGGGAAGVAAGSVSLVGFGFDSAIEVSAALILAWRLRRERRGGCMQADDHRATRAIAVSFAVLAAYVGVESVRALASGSEPDASVIGIVMASLSLVLMPVLARAKLALAPALGSAAAVADAKQTNLCALLSGVLLVGLSANAVLGWWWADPLAGLAIAGIALAEARRTWTPSPSRTPAAPDAAAPRP